MFNFLRKKIANIQRFNSVASPKIDRDLLYSYYDKYSLGSAALLPLHQFRYPALYTAVSKIATSIATMPIRVVDENGYSYQQVAKNKVKASIRRRLQVLNSPNPLYPTPYAFWERLATSLAIYANAYIVPQRNSVGDLLGLELGVPQSAYIVRGGVPGNPNYVLNTEYSNNRLVIPHNKIIHIKVNAHYIGEQQDDYSLRGIPPVVSLRTTIDLGDKSNEYIREFFSNSTNGEVYIEATDAILQEDQKVQLIERIEEIRRSGKSTIVLPEGAKAVHPSQRSAQDKNLADLRNQQVSFFAAAYGIPPELCGVGALKDIETTNRVFYRYCLSQYLTAIEQAFSNLFPDGYYFSFDITSLLKGDIKTCKEIVQLGLGGSQATPFLTRNEARRMLNYPPIDNPEFDIVQKAVVDQSDSNED